MSEPKTSPSLTLHEHMREIRKSVRPENCARDPEKMRAAARKRWDRVKAEKTPPEKN